MSEAAPAPIPAYASATAAVPRLAPGIGPDGAYTRGGQIVAFLFGLWTMVLFFPLLFPGALLYTRAEERFEQSPDRARTLVMWSWLSITVAPLVAALLLVAVVLAVSQLTG
jgi:hypothetical protein